MLKSRVAQFSNIIFLKTVGYLFLISIIYFVQFLQNNKLKSISNENLKIEFLNQEVKNRIRILSKSKENILNLYEKYDQICKNQIQKACIQRSMTIKKIKALDEKFNINGPIKISMIHKTLKNRFHDQNSTEIVEVDLSVNFKVNNPNKVVPILTAIYDYMPKPTLITSVNIEEDDVITPKHLKGLLRTKPTFVNVKLELRYKELYIK